MVDKLFRGGARSGLRSPKCNVHEAASLAAAAATAGCTGLAAVVAADGVPLFEVDNRGKDAFAMLTYPHDVGERQPQKRPIFPLAALPQSILGAVAPA
jgi:hypothetical protein